jgi:hypothetical protein
MAAPLPVGAHVDIVAPESQMHGEWGVVAACLGDGTYLVSPWGDDAAQLYERGELRVRRAAPSAAAGSLSSPPASEGGPS